MTPANSHSHDARMLANLAADVARSVGTEIHSIRASGVEIADTKTSLADVVTRADQRAESLAQRALLTARPDDGLLGEEGAHIVGSSGITWVVDPIDGTVNYLYDLPFYGVSVAATVTDGAEGTMEDGRRAIAGAVYLPVFDEIYTAWEHGGSYLGGEPIHGPSEKPLETTLLATGFGYTPERRTEQVRILQTLLPQVRDIRRMGSAAADLCMLAAGRIDAYYERGLNPWDYAAAALIAREAGASVRGLDGANPGTSMLIAAAPNTASELHAQISQAYSSLGE
ncbi:inositol monophosphatase family protein [Leucobacter denitrificans]|uniref:Inositol-1-monophosphatase n=1 Tax=Leucobacter denitrificans TaxID=683042 RepID=A0A7G9S4L4_9MICO|nr:inositol monophosphatase family protein [Leucobacter denitrificans]QNN62789.1 inositol monophosphatase [Leucobacter denitrificans]